MKISQDKLIHFFASAWLVFAIYLFTNDFDWAFLGAFGLGFGKELYDKFIKKTEIDFYDLVADFAGCWASLLLIGIKMGLV
jgi:hypothetical protein